MNRHGPGMGWLQPWPFPLPCPPPFPAANERTETGCPTGEKESTEVGVPI